MRTAMYALLVVATLSCGISAAGEKSDLRILYVGVNPETAELTEVEKVGVLQMQRLLEFKKARTPSFERFLSEHFVVVDVVFADEYEESQSNGYDVTIFGDDIKPIKEAVREQNADGSWTFEPEVYLSSGFDRAAILINTMGPNVSEALEYKMDWLCYCLDANAHDVKQEHPILNTPVNVDLTIASQPTPENYSKYYSGRYLPESLPMWRVQTEGYMDGKGFPIGMVSSGMGFDDAPDSEVIAGGVNTKPATAVALARHGNFFHWGFAAAPDEMTDEAKQVFLNTIHYIVQFDGEKPFSRRQLRAKTRDLALDSAYRASDADEQYKKYVEFIHYVTASDKKVLLMKQESGEKLSFNERRMLAQESPEVPTMEEYIEQRILGRLPDELVSEFGMEFDKYLDYYEENLEYLMPASGRYQYLADEDVVALGVSNRDPAILDTAISLWEQDSGNEHVRRILERYTTESFESASEWRAWYEANAGRFYFAELNGHKFRVIPASSANGATGQ